MGCSSPRLLHPTADAQLHPSHHAKQVNTWLPLQLTTCLQSLLADRQHASRHAAGQSPGDSLSNDRRSTRHTQQHANEAELKARDPPQAAELAAETTGYAANAESSAPEAADARAQAAEVVAGATSAAATSAPAVEIYLARIRPSWTQHWHEAVARQARPSAADAGLLHGMVDVDGGNETLQQRILHVNALMDEVGLQCLRQ